jgi:hypothetical protein
MRKLLIILVILILAAGCTSTNKNISKSTTGYSVDDSPTMDTIIGIKDKHIYKFSTSTIKNNKPLTDTLKSKFDGNGYHKLYNLSKKISKKAYFNNYQLMDGLWYRYDEDGVLLKIEIYKNGKVVKDSIPSIIKK